MESDFQEINDIEREIGQLDFESRSINDRKTDLLKRQKALEYELEKLKDWIWKTNNTNIVELRRELLAAGRLAYDEDEKLEKAFKFDSIRFTSRSRSVL